MCIFLNKTVVTVSASDFCVVQSEAFGAMACLAIRERILTRMQTLLRIAFASIKKDGLKQPTACAEINIVASMCTFLQACCAKENVNLQVENMTTFKIADRLVLFAIVWSAGAALSPEHWAGLDHTLRKAVEAEKMDVGLPPSGLCFDLYLRCVSRVLLPLCIACCG